MVKKISKRAITKMRKMTQACWAMNDGTSMEVEAYVLPKPVRGLALMVHEMPDDKIANKEYHFSCTEMGTGWFLGRGNSPAAALWDAYLNIREYGADNVISILSAFWEHYPLQNAHLIPPDYVDMCKAAALIREAEPAE
jgi:hypothetical protein